MHLVSNVCLSDPLARCARVSPSRGGDELLPLGWREGSLTPTFVLEYDLTQQRVLVCILSEDTI